MRYEQYKTAIQQHFKRIRAGATWLELRTALALPYDRPCPDWTRRLEGEKRVDSAQGPAGPRWCGRCNADPY